MTKTDFRISLWFSLLWSKTSSNLNVLAFKQTRKSNYFSFPLHEVHQFATSERERERERTLRIRAQVRVAFWEETDIKSSAVHETYWYSLACFHFNKCDKLHTQVCGIWDCNPPKAGYFGAKHFNFQNPHPQTGL
jgi:hypothetical protein